MKRVYKFIIVVIFLALAIVSYVLYNRWIESKMGSVSFENVTEEEVNGVKYIENKDVGLRFVVPEGWTVLKSEEGLVMHSANFTPLSEGSFFIPKTGCWIEVYAKREKEGSDYDIEYSLIKEKIIDGSYCSSQEGGSYECEVVKISGFDWLREDNIKNEGNIGSFVNLRLPYNNKIFQIASYFFGEDKKKCSQDFNDFLTTIIIKK